MEKIIENNQVTIIGTIASKLTYSHDVCGEKFYKIDVLVKRLSKNTDIIPVTVSERLIDVNVDHIGEMVAIKGQFRSYNQRGEAKSRLILTVFAREIEILEDAAGPFKSNQIYLTGFITNIPIYRLTPSGREIADFILAVNREYLKSDYIPCICWGRNAKYASRLAVGTCLKLEGRIQSRVYTKTNGNGLVENRTAYEVSISKMEVGIDEKQSN